MNKQNLFSGNKLNLSMWIAIIAWIIIQLVVILLFWGAPQGSDQGAYMEMATDCYQKGEWYPMMSDIYTSYIWSPGLINFLILQLKLFGTLNLNMVFNLFMNLAIAAEIYYIGKKFFTTQTACVAVILWCVLYSNWMIVAPAGTEIPFLFLALTAFCLCLSRMTRWFFVAGILFALANWVRPLVVIFLFSVLVYMIWKKNSWKNYVALLGAYLVCILSIGLVTYQKIGYFVYQSTTSGVNLIMTSNDKAYGGVATSLLGDSTSTAFIENREQYTFMERDSIWKARSLEWIKHNPTRFITLYIKKLGGLYIEDSWSERPLLGGSGFVDSYVVGGKVSSTAFYQKIIGMGLKSLAYYLIFILFFYSLYIHRKELLSVKSVLLLLLLAGTCGTCLFAVSPRYHYPFLFVIVLFAAYGITGWYRLKNKENTNAKIH